MREVVSCAALVCALWVAGCVASDDDLSGSPVEGGVPSGQHCARVSGWDVEATMLEEQVLEFVNAARARGHDCDTAGDFGIAPALRMEPRLRCAARLHSQYMADVGDDFGHVERANGSDAGDRIAQAGYTFAAAGENVAVGPVSAQQVVEGWLESDGHCAAIMTTEYSEIGVGYAVGPYYSPGARVLDAPYWTQTFGWPR